MKKFLLAILCQILISTGLFATQWTVSNFSAAQFSSISAALSSAQVVHGDTLLITPSATAYAAFTVTKRLVFIGGGVNPEKENNLTTVVNGVTLGDSSSSTGSAFHGIDFGNNSNSLYFTSGGTTTTGTVRNIKFVNCRFGSYVYMANSSTARPYEMVFINCIFSSSNGSGVTIDGGSHPTAKSSFFNCIIGTYVQDFSSQQGTNFTNCVFLYASSSNNTIRNSQYLNFQNCIFYGRTIASTVVNSNFVNCLYYYPALPLPMPPVGNTGINNLTGMDPLFVNNNSVTNVFSFTRDYRLQAGSPGKNFGTDGTDLGVYGGNSAFSLTLEPLNSPIIRSFLILNSSVPSNGSIQFNGTVTKARNN